MKKSDDAMKFCGLILLLIVIVSLFVGVVSVEGIITDNITTDDNQYASGGVEDAKVPKLASRNPDFLAYLNTPPETAYGYIPPPIDLSHLDQLPVVGLPTLYALPSSFDWRDQSKVTPVKDQNYCGTCWDFGTTSVLESAVLIGESVAYDFSEHSVALCVDRSWYYLYDGSTDPCQAGGWSCLASEVFIKKGSVFETCNPYDTSALNCDGSCVCDNCPPVKKVDGYRLATNDGSQIEVIKNAVYNQGPVTMAFYYTSSGGYSVEPWGIIYDYYPCSGSANHLVSIIGWDDAVPHPNPSHAGTGAWIVKNSWGTGWGNEGFCYLAYDSSCVEEIAYLKYKDDHPGEELLYWDEAGHVCSMGYGDNSAWMANVFTATQSGDLTHVDFWTTSNNAQYELYVWNGFLGTELARQTGICQEYGYYSILLSESLSIDAGQQFTVGIKMTTPSFDYPIPTECKITGWVDPPIQTSVSFIRHTASGTWTDLANEDRNACLRARLTILVPPECDGSDTSCGFYPNCENCNDYDGCYEYGDGCEERDYYCESNEAGCNYIYSNRHTDYYDDFVNYCKSDEVWKHRLFHDFYCDGGSCTDHTSWVDDQLVENCNDHDGWYCNGNIREYRDYYCSGSSCTYTVTSSENCNNYDGWVDTGNTRWVDDPGNECEENEQKEQEYRDYTCSDGACTYSVTDTQWIDTGNTQNKDDGTICGCTANNTVKRCYGGVCTDTGICDSNCGADAACDGKVPGESCGVGRICNSTCKCVCLAPEPEISNVQAYPDSQEIYGWVNVSATVTDNVVVDTVKVNISVPDGGTLNATMEKIPATEDYYYNATYSTPGTYNYFIWANDTSGNSNTSAVYGFEINSPPTANFTWTPTNPTTNDTIWFTDQSSDSDGTIVNWTWDFGDGNISYAGGALDFDGFDDYVSVPYGSSFDSVFGSTTWTFDAWIRPKLQGGYCQDIFEGTYHKPRIYITKSGGFGLAAFVGGSYTALCSASEITADVWQHVAITSDGDKFHIYINGADMNNCSFQQMDWPPSLFTIGGRGSEWYNGTIGGVRIYDRTLSKNEIQNNYIGNVTSVGLVSEWNMDTCSGDIAFDSAGNNDGLIFGANWKTYVCHSYAAGTYQVSLTVRDDNGTMDTISKNITVLPSNIPPIADFTYTPLNPTAEDTITFIDYSSGSDGTIVNWTWDFGDGNISYAGCALDFDGIGDYVSVPYDSSFDSVFGSTTWTFDAWIRPKLQGDYCQDIFEGTYHKPRIYITKSGGFGLAAFVGGSYTALCAASGITADVWQHIAITSDGDKFHIYINGAETNNCSFQQMDWPPSLFTIGGRDSEQYNGSIGGIRIYDRTLSKNEIQNNYIGNVNSVGLVSEWNMDTGSGDIAFDSAGNNDGLIFGANWKTYVCHSYAAGTYQVSLTVRDDNGAMDTISKNITVLPSNIPPIADFTYTPLNPTTEDTITFIDYSSGSDGTIVNWTWDFGDGNISYAGCALDFDGFDDYVSVPYGSSFDSVFGSTTWTFDAWIRPKLQGDYCQDIFEGTYHKPRIYITKSGGFGLAAFVGGSYTALCAASGITADVWQHIAITSDGDKFHIYINGAETNNCSFQQMDWPPSLFTIGGRGSEQYNGSIGGIRIYDRTLSKNEIQNNYIGNVTSVGLVSEWNMDTCSGDIAFDSAGNNDGIIYGANWKTYVCHSYAAGTYQVSLTVRDDNGAMDTISKNITVLPSNIPPIADFTYTPLNPTTEDTITFIDYSSDVDGTIVNWTWDFGDGNISYAGCALDFDGFDDYVSVPYGSSVDTVFGSTTWTFDAWIRPKLQGDYCQDIFEGTYHKPRIYITKSGGFGLAAFVGGSYTALCAASGITADVWQHIAITSDGDKFHIYINGAETNNCSFQQMDWPPSLFTIGGRGSEQYNGSIGGIRIYDRTLSKNEIQNNYIGNVTSVGLVSEWNMDTCSGDIAFDSAGNNDGLIFGAKWKTYVSHSYAAGTYQVSLTVRDDNGAMDTISKQVTVSTQVVSVIFQH